ncbi:MAG: AAA family ATPase [Desulfobacteraceae bacterium]|jgi:type II secretory pathway predicted ATPase ExeA
MYLAYYNLSAKPFQISTDPAFLWLGPKHREALSTLRYGVMDNRGFLLLTGDVGTGKTTLIHALLKSLSREVVAATVPDPGLSPLDFFNYVARGFGFGTRFASKGDFLDHFIDFLERSHTAHKKVLLIIDESQRLTSALLEEIRLLSNIEKFEDKMLNIFFVGQNEFNQFLMLPKHKAIRQRITINYHITPLDQNETGAYIRHRLKVAGARMEIFDDGSIAEVFRFSKGYPRLINIICDHAMLTGFIKSTEVVTAGMVSDCAADLTLPQRELLQTEVAKAERPAAPLPAAVREPGPPPKAPPQNHWQRPALLVALLAALLLSALALYTQGFEGFKTLWRTQFQGMTADTSAPPPIKAVPQPPPPAGPPETPPPVSPAKPPATPVSKIQQPPTAKTAPPESAPSQAPETAPPVASVAPAPQPPTVTSAGTPAAEAEDPKPPPAAPVASQPQTAAPENAPGGQDPGRQDASQRLPTRSTTETLSQDDAGSGADPGGIIDWMLEKNKLRQ